MSAPEQAVILCGGLGTRLRPLTDKLPKPMAPVNGRPFLSYLVQQLHDQGIRRIVLLTGYRGSAIREYFGDGTEAGVAVTYSEGPAEWETSRRVFEARAQLDARFMLLYSDNYTPFNLSRLHAFHASRGTAISLLVQAKTSANIRLAGNGIVDLYDPRRAAPGLQYVELGYMIVERDRVIPSIDDPDASFSLVLRRLAAENALAGMVTEDPYRSISDLDRLRQAERYLAPKRVLLIDRDGTINARPPKAEYITTWGQFHWVDSTVAAMRDLAADGFRFIVVSNQAGIARGMVQPADVEAINARMCEELGAKGIDIMAVYVCPHHWDDGCRCRKPEAGMFIRASAEHDIRLDRTIYVGDDPRDGLAAFHANCVGALVGPERHQADGTSGQPAGAAETLPELVPWIRSRFDAWERVA